VLILFGIVLMVLGVVADLLSVNRRLLEDVLLRLKRIEYGEPETAATARVELRAMPVARSDADGEVVTPRRAPRARTR
jgi:hypothetical protein